MSRVRSRLTLGVATTLMVLAPRGATAQTRTLTACTPDVLIACAELQLTVASGGLFQIGLRTIGSTAQPLLPMSVYNIVFGTGSLSVSNPVSSLVEPAASGGSTVSDPSEWEVFDTGDLLFLSALTNRGVGGCVTGPDQDGFGQAVTTCGIGQFATFTFAPTTGFDPRLFTLLDLEAVALTTPAEGASCGAPGSECVITADAISTPEPSTLGLFAIGLMVAAGAVNIRRRA